MAGQLIDDAKWKKRMGEYFSYIDKNHDGFITIEEVQQWASNMEKLCNGKPNEMVSLRAQLYVFWGKIGLKQNVFMTKEEFVSGVNKLGNEELRRKRNGSPTVLEKVNRAWFNVMDTDHDGILTLDELRTVMTATNMDPSSAHDWLEQLDKTNKGGITKNDYIKSEHNFWYKAKGLSVA